MNAAADIATLWAFIIAFAVFVYVVMDGFDLGLGLLFPLFPQKTDRDVIMNSVAPVWDGNETWLVLGGGGLMAAFPLAYAVLMPAIYTPLIAMLIGLIGARSAKETAGTSRLPPDRGLRRWRKALRSARSCRACRSKAGTMPAAGGTG
jgi:cytochrome bd ubiquinol oxidase subunit II